MSSKSLKTTIRTITARFARQRGLFLCLAVLSAMTLVDVPGIWSPMLFIAAVAVLKATVLTVILSSLMGRRRWLDIVCYSLVAIYGLAALINFVSYRFYGNGISRSLFIIALQTNSSEVAEFSAGVASNILGMLASWRLWGAVAATLLLWFVIRRLPAKVFVAAALIFSLTGGVALGTVLLTTNRQRMMNFMALRIAMFSYDAWRAQAVYDNMITDRRPFPDPEAVRSSVNVTDLIIIVGESASRGHHSIYGYPLATSPRLGALGDSLFVFTNARAASFTTVENMERIMTFMRHCDPDGLWADYPSIIDLMSIAGYKTYFLSNQEKFGAAGGRYTLDGVFAAQSDTAVFTGQLSARDADASRYDGLLLPPLAKALSDTADARFIVMHLMGSHQVYRERYPAEFGRFTAADILPISSRRPWLSESKAQTVAEYDNSILYADSIVGAAISLVSKSARPSVVIYFSDHGEDVYDSGDYLTRSAKTVDVPFVIYANAAWLDANPELTARIRAAVDRPFLTSDLIYAVMTLTGTSYPLYEPTLDLLSPDFETSPH